uniref:Uncharacterized protein n=1 Tax=Plectus sambesii TaxID=2011161 RepID=A0A914X192_9BILA
MFRTIYRNLLSTDSCKDSTPALCLSVFQLCQAPKHCGGKKGETHENKGDEDSDDNEDAICAWVRMQPHPDLREISAQCDQENAATQRQSIRDGLFGGRLGPKLPKKLIGNQKRLDCRLQKDASVYFQILCPATCNAC